MPGSFRGVERMEARVACQGERMCGKAVESVTEGHSIKRAFLVGAGREC